MSYIIKVYYTITQVVKPIKPNVILYCVDCFEGLPICSVVKQMLDRLTCSLDTRKCYHISMERREVVKAGRRFNMKLIKYYTGRVGITR